MLKFVRKSPYKGVSYSNNNLNWEFKHQVPIINKLPKEYIRWANLRFSYSFKVIPNDTGETYDGLSVSPLFIGDVVHMYNYYIGVISEINIEGTKEEGFYINIIYDKTFEKIGNELVLSNKKRIDKLNMEGFLWFFHHVSIYSLDKIKYVSEINIIPYYLNIINSKDLELKSLKKDLEEYKKIIGNIDERISQKIHSNQVKLDDVAYRRKKKEEKEKEEIRLKAYYGSHQHSNDLKWERYNKNKENTKLDLLLYKVEHGF